MRIIILLLGAIAYYLIWFLAVKMILQVFHIKRRIPFFVGGMILGGIPLFCVMDYIFRGIPFVEGIAYAGYLLLGFFIYYILSLGFVALIRKIIYLIKKEKKQLIEKSSILLATGMSFGICLWGILAAQIPEYTYQRMDIGLKEHLKITVVSDIHYGATGSLLSLERLVENINKTEADVVLFVGDVFDNKIKHLDHTFFADTMRKISCSYGVYAVTGNHEFMQNDLEQIQAWYQDTNIHLLLDEEVIIHQSVRIAGRIDYRGGRKEIKDIFSDSTLPLIVLDHQPQYFRDAKDVADLQISGHTHNGQIFPGEILLFLLNQLFFQSPSDGVHQYGDFTLAITRGYGTWGFPMRLTGPSQIMVFEL